MNYRQKDIIIRHNAETIQAYKAIQRLLVLGMASIMKTKVELGIGLTIKLSENNHEMSDIFRKTISETVKEIQECRPFLNSEMTINQKSPKNY